MVAGNWKLHLGNAEGRELALGLSREIGEVGDVDVVLAPVFTVIATVVEAVAGTNIAVAAQNVYWEKRGAFTGEVSADHLLDVGCRYVIVGHSERRQYFGEQDADVQRKTIAALDSGLTPILCVGETLEIRQQGREIAFVVGQLQAALSGMSAEQLQRIVCAYEPIWAIGTGKTASPADAQQMHGALRKAVALAHGADIANGMRILYGGSVKADNAADLMAQPDVDGALVGGAALNVESFSAIVRAAR
jgi:triosephosphate isomerase